MTDENSASKEADKVCEAIYNQITSLSMAYDCRLILGALLGQTSVFAAGMRQAKVVTAEDLKLQFGFALNYSLEDGNRVPVVRIIGDQNGSGRLQ